MLKAGCCLASVFSSMQSMERVLTWKLVCFGARFLQYCNYWMLNPHLTVLPLIVMLFLLVKLEVAKEFGPLVDCLAKIFLQSLAAILFAGMPRREKSTAQIGRCFSVFGIVQSGNIHQISTVCIFIYIYIYLSMYLSIC